MALPYTRRALLKEERPTIQNSSDDPNIVLRLVLPVDGSCFTGQDGEYFAEGIESNSVSIKMLTKCNTNERIVEVVGEADNCGNALIRVFEYLFGNGESLFWGKVLIPNKVLSKLLGGIGKMENVPNLLEPFVGAKIKLIRMKIGLDSCILVTVTSLTDLVGLILKISDKVKQLNAPKNVTNANLKYLLSTSVSAKIILPLKVGLPYHDVVDAIFKRSGTQIKLSPPDEPGNPFLAMEGPLESQWKAQFIIFEWLKQKASQTFYWSEMSVPISVNQLLNDQILNKIEDESKTVIKLKSDRSGKSLVVAIKGDFDSNMRAQFCIWVIAFSKSFQ